MFEIDYLRCTACGACKQACPTNCITLTSSEEGFLFPYIDEKKCINCHKCESACPIGKDHKIKENFETLAYGAIAKDKTVLHNSASGGLFSLIAVEVLHNGGVVYGCAYQDQLRPIHIRIDSVKDINKLQGSKYVQSNTENTFREAYLDLKKGKTVLFSGTPCQIAGLRGYLGKDYDNLITVDIVCHGVSSFAYFQKYIKGLEKKQGAIVKKFCFRSKKFNKWSTCGTYTGYYLLKFTGRNNNLVQKKINYFDSYYYYYFLHGDIYRESCYHCEYANMQRQGDITCGDLWGAEAMGLKFDVSNGCSLVLLNSKKGRDVFAKLKIYKQNIDVDEAVKNNRQLHGPTAESRIRLDLLADYKTLTAKQMQQKFIKTCRIQRWKAKISYSLPPCFKKKILRFFYRRK